MTECTLFAVPVAIILGWFLDVVLGDPAWLPHPVVGFGKMIAFGEHRLNKGGHRKLKGALMSIFLIVLVFVATYFLRKLLSTINFSLFTFHFSLFSFHFSLFTFFDSILIFFCLAGTTLVHEVRDVFRAVDCSVEEGRRQVARIVGRDTSELSAQEIRTAALETLAENLSDGVVAPLFWLAVGGPPAMMAYKMVNTLDSMIGYRTARYADFGCWAAHIDDVANYIPARITALLMILSAPFIRQGRLSLFTFVHRNGRKHASPNSGYPEAALAGILDCRFGGPHVYFGELVDKPYIGENNRLLTTDDMHKAIRVNRVVEVFSVAIVLIRSIL